MILIVVWQLYAMPFNLFNSKKKKQPIARPTAQTLRQSSNTSVNENTLIDYPLIRGEIASVNDDRDDMAYKSGARHRSPMFAHDDLNEIRKRLEERDIILHERIGTGTYADVYRGTNRTIGKDVAIKVITLNEANRHYQETHLQNELQVIRKLRHRRIIRLYSIVQVGNVLAMVMEYASRGNISDLIAKRGALREAATWALFKEMMKGIWYMHSLSIAHRDLKLENVLLSTYFIPKLCDFSFAIVFDGKTLCTTWCGSLPYFAPELLTNQPYNPLQSDIWSAAVCVFIIANDSFPFKIGDEVHDALNAQLNRRWRLRRKTEETYDEMFRNMLNHMLEPSPANRLTARQVLAHPWITTDRSGT